MSFRPESNDIRHWSVARRSVAGVAAVLSSIVVTHGLAAVLRHLGPAEAPLAAVGLTLAAAVVAIVGAALLPRRSAALAAAGVAAGAVVALQLVHPGAWAGALALLAVAPAVTAGARWLGDRLPAGLDGVFRRRRVAAVAWTVLALVSVVQVGRLASHVTDPEVGFFLTTEHPFWYGHECLPAYLHAAELAQQGAENVYDVAHWPALNPQATPQPGMEGMHVEDPYQYPPQFLLLPGLATALTDDYLSVRAVWFTLNVGLFVTAYVLLALWVGGRAGRTALWLLPAVLAAFPLLHNFQFGQFHVAAVALAAGGMVAFAVRRRALGGLLLASAVLAKMFPAVLLVWLLGQRRFKDLAWTAGWGLALTALTLALFGPAPFTAFVGEHLPNLGNGAAFAFDEAWPELAELVVLDNQGVFGLAMKAGVDKPEAGAVSKVFTLLVLALAGFVGVRLRRAGEAAGTWAQGVSWLALLGLASLASPGAWGDYVPATAVWLLALVAARAAQDRRLVAPLLVTAAFEGLLLGTMPLGDWMPVALMLPVSALGAVLMLVLFGTVLAARPEAWRQAESAVPEAGEPEALPRAA